MNKFFLMTRGRTGSTAVVDELNKCRGVRATQELFLKNESGIAILTEAYDFILPFDVWKLQISWYEQRLSFEIDGRISFRYLQDAEARAQSQGMECFCFKLLSHHLEERPFLGALLKRRGYRAIYLTRNISRQVISGMVANQRGIYNTTDAFDDSRKYTIDLDVFQELVEWEARCVKMDCAYLEDKGFSYITVSYEEFCNDRQLFFDKLFKFLEVRSELPPVSGYSVMIKDIKSTINNYNAVAERAAMIGVDLDA